MITRLGGKTIRVVLADDHAMVREGLSQLLQDSQGIEVVGQAGDGKRAVMLARDLRPDVVILDYTMPEGDAATCTRKILSLCPDVKILVLTVHENVHYALKALQAGAHGFVLKAAAVEELVRGIRTVSAGKVYISPVISERMLEAFGNTKKGERSGLNALSPREFELVRLISSGLKLQECARAMHIMDSTASTYRARLMEKLGLKTTAEIIRFALENGIVS
jgi:DNA-binding NarL/FixJ family response regulator